MESEKSNGELGDTDSTSTTELEREYESLTSKQPEEISPAAAVKLSDDKTKELSVKEMLAKLLERKEAAENKPEDKKKKPAFQWPKLWSRTIEKNSASRENAVVLYFNQKGMIEDPRVVPIEAGNMVIIKGSPYEVDPRAFWLVKLGKNVHKILCIKEIDRRPISNLDIDEIRQRGDSTDSDSFLIKAALKEQMTNKEKKPMPKWILWIIGAVVVGGLIFFFMQGGGSPATPTVLP
jgi:hypothetical protein